MTPAGTAGKGGPVFLINGPVVATHQKDSKPPVHALTFRLMTSSRRSTGLAGCLLVAVALLVVRPGGSAVAQSDDMPAPRASYTAETTVTYGGDTLEMRTQHHGSWERQEFSIDDLEQVTVLRPDRNRAYVMFLQSRQLLELPYAEAALLPTFSMLRRYETRKLSETVIEGEAVGHFQVVQEVGEQAAKDEPAAMLDLWVTADGIVMKAEGEILVDGYREPLQLLRKNVRRGALDPELFEPSIAIAP